jgi:signal transduction histidine kinase
MTAEVDIRSHNLTPEEPTGRTSRVAAYALTAVVVALWVLGGLLLTLNRHVIYGNQWFLWGLFTLTGVAYVASALAIVRRHPSNAIWWLFFLIAISLAVGTVLPEYGIYAIRVSPGALPAPALAIALAEPTPIVAIVGIFLVLQLFPDGRPVSPRWRIVVWVTAFAIIVGIAGQFVAPHRIHTVWSDDLEHAHVSVLNPMGVAGLRTIGVIGQTIASVLLWVIAVLSIASLFVRCRKADALQHTQLRWLAYVVGLATAWIVVMLPLMVVFGDNSIAAAVFWLVATPLVALGIPIAVGIAIVRHRLLDIDVVISKTIVYGALAAFITIVYVGLVVGIGQIAGSVSTPALSAVAAAIVAIAFQPLRRRVQRVANRFVYGDRATPYEVLSGFSEHLAGMYGAQDLLGRMAQVVAEGTGASEARVWVAVGNELRPSASWPELGSSGESLPLAAGALPTIPEVSRAVEVSQGGELLGAITVSKPPSDPLTPTEERLLTDLAGQAGLVLRNVRLIEELRASRQRIVAAQDERARALERNIHDGAQQQLVALAVKLRLARSFAEKDPPKAGELLDALQAEAVDALENLRDLARGIYPPLLADQGLAAALGSQARKSAVPVSVEADGVGRYPQDVEAAVYFCALEALQNISKYANASSAVLRLSASNGDLRFEVVDDGAGFDPSTTRSGSGLQGMADRLDAVGGRLSVRSVPGEGTTVVGSVPAVGAAG